MDPAKEYVQRILKVMIFIEENINEELTLNKLAKIACYSPFHFHRIFQAIAQETVHRYVIRLRMQIAAAKLRYTSLPVTEIALDANFETPSSFTKAFKQFMGSSPKSYRALHSAINITTKKITELPMIQPDTIEKSMPELNILFVRRTRNYTLSAELA